MTQTLSGPPVLELISPQPLAPPALPIITAEVIDALTDSIVLAGTDVARAAVMRALVGHMLEAVTWWHGAEPDDDELASLSRLGQAASDHLQSMIDRSL